MNFFDSIVLPQSAEHIELLHYLMILIQFLFLPFLSVILIGTFLSLRYWKKGAKENNLLYLQFSKDVLNTISVNKSLGAALGFLPIVTSILIYAQLLHKSSSSALLILTVALPLIILGFLLTYTFKYYLSLNELFSEIGTAAHLDEIVKDKVWQFSSAAYRIARRSGVAGLALLAIGSWYYISAVSSAVFSENWDVESKISILFSLQSIISFAQFLLLAVALTGGAILFGFFYWEGSKKEISDDYKNFVKRTSITMLLSSLLVLPVVLFANNLLLPQSSLSGSIFTYLVIALVLIFICYHLLYAISKTSNLKLSGQLFFILLFVVLALVIKDQMAMSNSTKLHSAVLSEEFNKYLAELKGENLSAIKIRSGEEIFQVVCSACHRFDEKLVGPPYNKVLVKYEGKMDELIGFILNPVKVDPAYPPMPNQGLRRDEAKNIAEYLMEQHLKSTPK